jgi:hypothetical protein
MDEEQNYERDEGQMNKQIKRRRMNRMTNK